MNRLISIGEGTPNMRTPRVGKRIESNLPVERELNQPALDLDP
jgi:hypothetical protein